MALPPRTRLGPYEIVALLGAGGMGEVYRARDTKLGREVAVKVLPPAFTQDAERLARFEREARLLASLNHPHIAAIYGVEDTPSSGPGQGPLRALVLELVEGQGLDEKIRGGRVPVEEALAMARQIADALDAAHERGIVHRDLKPANIRITPDGTVKVLDFGLAKATEDAPGSDFTHSPTTLGPTEAGTLLGTAPYMSPEQARGKLVDKRTDIWAFGCVLYEMLTSRRAFAGETTSDTIAAILEREPDWGRLPATTPPHVQRLLHRCLEKEPKRRLRDIGDARRDLEAGDAPVSAPARASRYAWLGWAAAGAMALVAAGVATRAPKPASAPAMDGTIERLTLDSGISSSPSLSSAGHLLAYASTRSGRGDLDIWVHQMAGGSPLRITDDLADDTDPDLSPDGARVVFRSERNGGGIYLASALGGPARLIAPEGRDPRFSPDGTAIAYWTGQFRGQVTGTNSSAFVQSLSGGAAIRLMPDFVVVRDPIWAPDGKSLLVMALRVRPAPAAEAVDWWLVPLDGRPPMKTAILDRPGWHDHLEEGQTSPGTWNALGFMLAIDGRIWSLPLAPGTGLLQGEPRSLLFGASRVARPVASRDGVVVFSQWTAERVVQRAPLTTADAPLPVMRLFGDSNPVARRASQTSDGQTIVFERESSPAREIWRKNLRDGAEQLVLAVESKTILNPTLSPDGRVIGYVIDSGREGLSVTVGGTGYVVSVDGGVPRKVCEHCGIYEFLSDSRRAVIADGDSAIRAVDIVSGQKTELIADPGARVERPSVSPDDRWLAFRRTVGTVAKVYLASASGGATMKEAVQIDEPTPTGRPCGWSPDSRILYLLLDTDGSRCLWGQRVDPATGHLIGKPYVVRHFHGLDQASGIGTSLGNAITSQGFLFETLIVRSSLWRLTPAR